jgi:hypothetical protein
MTICLSPIPVDNPVHNRFGNDPNRGASSSGKRAAMTQIDPGRALAPWIRHPDSGQSRRAFRLIAEP